MNTPKIAKTTSFAVLAIAAVGMLVLSTAIAKPAFASSDKDNHDNERHNNHDTDCRNHDNNGHNDENDCRNHDNERHNNDENDRNR